jgi:hypothetical protein
MKHGQEKSDLFIVALKPANKPGRPGRGVGGAKGEDRGEHERATHVPDTAPGKRVPEAQLCTNKLPVGFVSLITQGGSPVRESRPPGSVRGAPSNGCPYRERT